jgi:5-methylthioadenosine/S-adenosylhomocysteine deaminase
MASLLIRNGTVLTNNSRKEIFAADVLVKNGRIAAFQAGAEADHADQEIDAAGSFILPGLIQVHVHLNQTLFRGLADDMNVVDWLRKRIWPLEQAHNYESAYASARLSIAEMIRSGVTTALTLETTRHTEAAFDAAMEMGFRAFIGNAIMDRWETGTEMVGEDTAASLERSAVLSTGYHGAGNGRIHYSYCPRGTRNATDEMWQELGRLAREQGKLIHTHAAENREQTDRLAEYGGTEVEYLNRMGVLGDNLVVAHGIWLSEAERGLLAESGTSVAHCPSANLKLASGFAAVPEMLAQGVNVAIGSDGAPCNNNLDIFNEMRLAALIHKPRCGPESMTALQVFEMATRNASKALGIEDQVGSIEVGKRADIVIVRRNALHGSPTQGSDPYGQIVYALQAHDVDTVIVDGTILLRDGQFTQWDHLEIVSQAQAARAQLLDRVENFE